MATKAKGRGKPPIDDHKALEAIRKKMRKRKNLTHYAAAFKYAEENPEAILPSSTARRLADKLKAKDGIPKRLTDASLRADLLELKELLLRVVQVVDRMIDRLPKHPRK